MSLPSATASTAPAGLADLDSRIAEQEAVFLAPAAAVGRAGGAGPALPGRRGDVELADRRAAGRLAHARQRARRSTTSTARSTSTCTAGTASRWSATPTRRSCGPSPSGSPSARTSRSPPRTRSSSPRSSPGGSACRCGGSATPGTEATMDAVHLMRAATGRDIVIKVEGCYHGHHDSVEVSILPEAEEAGPAGPAALGAGQHRHPAGVRRPGRGRRLQRRGRRRPGARREPRPGGRHDRRAGDDERRHHPARPGLPRGRARPAARARCAARVRRGEDRPHRLPRRRDRRRSASRPTSSASPRRSAAACRWPRSAAPTR